MGEQPGTRWEDLPPDQQQEGYWLAVSDRKRICWGDLGYEVVYVARDAYCPLVWLIGMDDCESPGHWRFLRRLELPGSAQRRN